MKKLFTFIVLAAFFVACTPEKIETAFKLAGGKVIVNVEVVDIINGGAYTGPYDVKSNVGTVSGNQIIIQAIESQPLPSGKFQVTVSGEKLAKDYSSDFVVPDVLAGGEAIIKVVVPVGEPQNGWTVDWAVDEDNIVENDPTIEYLVNEHYLKHSYSHDGIDSWYFNNTEFKIPGTVEYKLSSYALLSDVVDNNILGFEGEATRLGQELFAAYDKEDVPEVFDFTVSAYAMWNITRTITSVVKPYLVFATKEGEQKQDLGSFKLEHITANLVEYHELPYPGAPSHAHYELGHGHDAHGSMPNAGGGLSYNE